jgi:hypothetical protein
MTVLYCCRIYAVVAASFLSAGLLAPEGASAALTERAVQQRSLLFAKTPDDGNEGDEGDEGDEVRSAFFATQPLQKCQPCTLLPLLCDKFAGYACTQHSLQANQLSQEGQRVRQVYVTALSALPLPLCLDHPINESC